MEIPGFIYGSYESQSPIADQERTVNWYVEPIESGHGTTGAALYPTPGVEVLDTASGANPGRAHFFEDNREFAVIGDTFYEISGPGVLTSRGTVAVDSNPATICSNGDGGGQLFITSGGNGYIFTLSTNTLSSVAALAGIATMGDFLEGYFLALDADTSTLYISALFDGTSWTPGTDYARRTVGADPWVSMKVLGRYVWLLGEKTSEAWYNSGDTFPLSFHPSGFAEYGCSAPFSVANGSDQALYWLGSSSYGDGFVMRTTGFAPEVVSSIALQKQINGYDVISDAQGYIYNDLGHTFYVLNFNDADVTWALDTALGPPSWCERGTWISEENQFVAWRPRWYARAFGEHRCLDSQTGAVYRISSDLTADVDSREIRRLRRAPALFNENRRLSFSSFELDLEPGLGAVTGQGQDPQVMMRFSDDGGKTWSNEYWRSAGALGEYSNRVRWLRLGQGRRRVFEVSVTDPIPWRITNAYATFSPSTEAR